MMPLPAWLQKIVASLPVYVQWMLPAAMQMVLHYLVPALEKAFPAEAPLIEDIVKWLTGQQPSGAFLAAHQSYHSARAAAAPGVVNGPTA